MLAASAGTASQLWESSGAILHKMKSGCWLGSSTKFVRCWGSGGWSRRLTTYMFGCVDKYDGAVDAVLAPGCGTAESADPRHNGSQA